jgi:hypothetical protein
MRNQANALLDWTWRYAQTDLVQPKKIKVEAASPLNGQLCLATCKPIWNASFIQGTAPWKGRK